MITVQETTTWVGNNLNHKYILSDDKRWMYGYIPAGDTLPQLFNKPIGFDSRGRSFVELIRTKDVSDDPTWHIRGSKGNTYTVSLHDGEYSCTCPSSQFRKHFCKHMESVKNGSVTP